MAHNLLLVAVIFGFQVFKPWAALLNPRKMSYQKEMFKKALAEHRDEAKPVGYTAMEALHYEWIAHAKRPVLAPLRYPAILVKPLVVLRCHALAFYLLPNA